MKYFIRSKSSRRPAALLAACALALLCASSGFGQSAVGWSLFALTNGVLMIGPQGTVSYCSATSVLGGVNITPSGHCIVVSKNLAVPATDKWTVTATIGGAIGVVSVASAYLLDNTNGRIIECSVADDPGSGNVNGACKDFGNLPQ